MRRTAEFDAFGPWVFEVESPEDVPRLYRDHPLDLDAAHLVLKVPRRIWRRDANPDMDLYDHLLVAGRDGVTVLSRRGDRYSTVEVPYARIAALRTSVDLLDGHVTIQDTQGPAPSGVVSRVRYNSVSKDLVQRLSRIVAEQALAAAPGAPGTAAPGPDERATLALRDLGDSDVALVTEQRELSAHETLVPIGTQHRARLPRSGGGLSSLLDAVRPVTLQAAVICAGPGQLHVIHRRQWYTTGRRPVHSVAHTRVLLPRVTSVDVRDVGRLTGAATIMITLGRSVVEVPVPRASDSAAAILGALGTSPTR